MIPYIFMIAALISIFAVLIIFKLYLNRLIEEPETLVAIQRRFLISIGISKVIPIILLIFGMAKMSEFEQGNVIIPILIIVVAVIYTLYDISKQNNQSYDQKTQQAVYTLIFIARPLIFSIPLMAIIFLVMLMR